MIALIPAGNPGPLTGPSGNNTWLVDGAEPLLVDAGTGSHSHIAALRAALGSRPLARVFVTHAHPDHAAGIPALGREWPSASIIGGDGRAPGAGSLPAGDGRLEILPTPGHSPDHACLWDPETRELFAGDLVVKGGTIMILASRGGNLRAYLDSLARVRALAPRRIYPGHGPVIADGVALIDEYIAHRAAREAQVLDVLAAGPATPEEMVTRIYAGLAPALHGAARETVIAHLRKLEDEGRATEREGVWSLRT